MIVMTRKKHESIVINNDITVLVVEIRGDKVRLGVDAPSDVPFHRREVYDAIIRNQEDNRSPEEVAFDQKKSAVEGLWRTRLAEARTLEQLEDLRRKLA